jgi:NAD-dependent deacetylase
LVRDSGTKKAHLVVLSGAGISAESGIATFRGADGLWEGYDIREVASPQAWHTNQALVLDFYNQRRKDILSAAPNLAHHLLADLEEKFDVSIITQNIDNFHERAGSSRILHLHGEITKARSTRSPNLIYDISGWELKEGDYCEKGSQLRPHIVWFGEPVPMIEKASEITMTADVLLVIGTSLQVYPAASLIHAITPTTRIFVIDPETPTYNGTTQITAIKEIASVGMQKLIKLLSA